MGISKREAFAAAGAFFAFAIFLLVWFWVLSPPSSAPQSQCALECGGNYVAISPAEEATRGTTNWYNFTIQSAGGGLLWSSLTFRVETSYGETLTLPSTATIGVTGLTGKTVATDAISTGAWTSGGSTAVSNQQKIVLTTPNTTSLSGDVFIVFGSGSWSGADSLSIP